MAYLPQTVEEAVIHLTEEISIGEIPTENVDIIKKCDYDKLSMFHHSLGSYIRNGFGMWAEDSQLRKSTGKDHPDDASMVIIQALWTELQKDRPPKMNRFQILKSN